MLDKSTHHPIPGSRSTPAPGSRPLALHPDTWPQWPSLWSSALTLLPSLPSLSFSTTEPTLNYPELYHGHDSRFSESTPSATWVLFPQIIEMIRKTQYPVKSHLWQDTWKSGTDWSSPYFSLNQQCGRSSQPSLVTAAPSHKLEFRSWQHNLGEKN